MSRRRPRTSGFTYSFRPPTSFSSSHVKNHSGDSSDKGTQHSFQTKQKQLKTFTNKFKAHSTNTHQSPPKSVVVSKDGYGLQSKDQQPNHYSNEHSNQTTGTSKEKEWKRDNGAHNKKNSSAKAIQSDLETSEKSLSSTVPPPGKCINDFKILKILGRGAHGIVHLAKSHVDNKMYVLKQINVINLKEHRRKRVVSEVLLLRRLRHPNIIQYYTSFVDNGSLYIVMEYANAGDMYTEIKRRGKMGQAISEEQVWDYFQQIAAGLQYLHHHNIIHRDVKSMNVFLMSDGGVKLGDLGVSRLMEDDGLAAEMSRVGTPMYFAPELVKREAYDQRVDIWSLGCLVYTAMKLRPPFSADNIYALAIDIVKKKPPPLPRMYSSTLCHLVSLMLEKSSFKRPSIDELVDMFPSHLQQRTKEAAKETAINKVAENYQKNQEHSINSTVSTISLSTGTQQVFQSSQKAAVPSAWGVVQSPQFQSSRIKSRKNSNEDKKLGDMNEKGCINKHSIISKRTRRIKPQFSLVADNQVDVQLTSEGKGTSLLHTYNILNAEHKNYNQQLQQEICRNDLNGFKDGGRSHFRNRPASAVSSRRRRNGPSGGSLSNFVRTDGSDHTSSSAVATSAQMNVFSLDREGQGDRKHINRRNRRDRRRPVSALPMKREHRLKKERGQNSKASLTNSCRDRPATAVRHHRSSNKNRASAHNIVSECQETGEILESRSRRSGTRERLERRRPQSAAPNRRQQAATIVVVQQWKPKHIKSKRRVKIS